jgi:cyclophilin family peptidyl-prolyl cis-trans isomerase
LDITEDEMMAVNGKALPRSLQAGAAVLVIGTALAGCNRPPQTAVSDPAASPPADSIVRAAKPEFRLQQPFAEATLSDMPDQCLPDVTLAGKSVGKLYEEVVRTWDRIAFLTAGGQPLHYRAVIETELGTIEIELFADLAPNHVRSFVALAQVGYFNGLVFERTIAEQVEDDPSTRVELVEGGCPTGTGNPGYGSIGYWLKPEFSEVIKHEEGSVGACRSEEPESAACRFYISLSKAPVMDGERTIFGKVTHGLDVVRRIATQPVLNSPDYPEGDRPEKPIVMRKVTIHSKK